jgi:hypothetical protein
MTKPTENSSAAQIELAERASYDLLCSLTAATSDLAIVVRRGPGSFTKRAAILARVFDIHANVSDHLAAAMATDPGGTVCASNISKGLRCLRAACVGGENLKAVRSSSRYAAELFDGARFFVGERTHALRTARKAAA